MIKEVKVLETGGFDEIDKAMKFLERNYVLVGIPNKKPPHNLGIDEDPNNVDEQREISNAELLFIHTNGSPINNIPARPVIEPAINNAKDKLNKLMKKAAKNAIDGKEEEALLDLTKLGMQAENECRSWFVNPANGWPENTPAVKRSKIKKGSSDPKPLIDTGQLRKSITHVIVKDGARQN